MATNRTTTELPPLAREAECVERPSQAGKHSGVADPVDDSAMLTEIATLCVCAERELAVNLECDRLLANSPRLHEFAGEILEAKLDAWLASVEGTPAFLLALRELALDLIGSQIRLVVEHAKARAASARARAPGGVGRPC